MNTGDANCGADRAYQFVIRQRLGGGLGPGDHLDSQAIGSAVDAGQTAVRDAVRRMRREGIVQPQGKAILCALPTALCTEALEALQALEPAAVATLPASKMDVDGLAAVASKCSAIVQATVQGQDESFPTAWRAASFEFHKALIESSPNATLRGLALDQRERLLFEDNDADPVAAARTWLFQTRILDRLYRKDPEGAAEHLRSLISWQMRFLRAAPEDRSKIEPPVMV